MRIVYGTPVREKKKSIGKNCMERAGRKRTERGMEKRSPLRRRGTGVLQCAFQKIGRRKKTLKKRKKREKSKKSEGKTRAKVVI